MPKHPRVILFFNDLPTTHRLLLKARLFSLPHLTEEENAQLNSALVRLRQFCVSGREHGLHLLVDAEYTYMNRGISAFALAMMVAFNTVSGSFTQSQCCPSSLVPQIDPSVPQPVVQSRAY